MKRNHMAASSALVRTCLFNGARPGPRLIVLGAVHGNETCGTIAIERVVKELIARELEIIAGQLTLVPVTNRLAYERGTRNGDRNLNRKLRPTATPQDNEDRIANELCPLLATHDVLLDLHSFGSASAAFVLLGPENNTGDLEPFEYASEEEALAERLGVSRAVDGWLATNAAGARWRGGSAGYGGGTTDYMRSVGGYGVTLECGQHTDPGAPEVAYRAIRRTLAHLRLIDAEAPELKSEIEMLRICEVIEYASANDRFAREWNSFDPLRRGDVVGYRACGAPVMAPEDGFIVFPNAKTNPGTEWFYFARRHPRLSKL
ncbi:succinylglutamate desuccinylase/aspartoacylase family protein [Bradyrhizobium sp. TZ2]